MRRTAVRLGLVLASAVVSLGMAELVTRVVGVGNASLSRGVFHQADADVGWVGRANLDAYFEQPGSFQVRVQTNSRGLRSRELPYEKAPGARRIVCLGDSFMWGYGVATEKMFSSVLERLVPAAETVNLGANGYSTVQELIQFEKEGRRYQPDAVVVSFCWNDLEDNLDDKHGGRPLAGLTADGELRVDNRPVRRPWKAPFVQWLRGHSRFYVAAEYSLKKWEYQRALAAERPGPAQPSTPSDHASAPTGESKAGDPVAPSNRPSSEAPGPAAIAALEPGSLTDVRVTELDVYAPPSPLMNHVWRIQELLLAELARQVRAVGAELIVLYAPDRAVVSPNYRQRFLAGLDPVPDDLDWARPEHRLQAVCDRLGIRMADPTDRFRDDRDPERLFLDNNMHWNAEGHRLAAEAVAELLADAP